MKSSWSRLDEDVGFCPITYSDIEIARSLNSPARKGNIEKKRVFHRRGNIKGERSVGLQEERKNVTRMAQVRDDLPG